MNRLLWLPTFKQATLSRPARWAVCGKPMACFSCPLRQWWQTALELAMEMIRIFKRGATSTVPVMLPLVLCYCKLVTYSSEKCSVSCHFEALSEPSQQLQLYACYKYNYKYKSFAENRRKQHYEWWNRWRPYHPASFKICITALQSVFSLANISQGLITTGVCINHIVLHHSSLFTTWICSPGFKLSFVLNCVHTILIPIIPSDSYLVRASFVNIVSIHPRIQTLRMSC